MQSLLNESEGDITSTHVHKLEANFHSRRKGLNYRESQGETAPHSSREEVFGTQVNNIKKKKDDKKSTRKLAEQPFSWTLWNILKRRQLRQMEQKSTRRNKGDYRIQSIFCIFPVWKCDSYNLAIL